MGDVREYWVVTDEGDVISGPHFSEQSAENEAFDRSGEFERPLIVTNSDDVY